MPYCPECGEEVGAADRFCQECGTALGQTAGGERRRTGRGGSDPGIDHGQSRQTGRGDSGIDYGQSRRPGGSDASRPGWDTGQGQRGRQAGRGRQQGRQSQGRQQGRQSRGRQPARGRQQPRADDTGAVSFSLSYPASGGAGGLIVGSLALVFFWLVVPFFLLVGYFVRMAAAAAAGRPEPPGLGEWTGMIKNGVVLVVGTLPIWLSYGVVTTLAADASGLLSFALVLLGSYLFPAIFVNYAVERRWQACYEVSTLTDLVTTGDYLLGYLAYVFLFNGIGFVVVVVLLVVTGITFVGIVLWPLILFYWYAISVALWGKVYRQAMGPATIPDPPTQPRQQARPPQQGAQPRQQQRY